VRVKMCLEWSLQSAARTASSKSVRTTPKSKGRGGPGVASDGSIRKKGPDVDMYTFAC